MIPVPLDLILVSPLRRALQTCYHIFKGGEHKVPIQVHSEFAEIVESSGDIGDRLKETMEKIKDFDYSRIKNIESWYLNNVSPDFKA